jgi:hypothetical protein
MRRLPVLVGALLAALFAILALAVPSAWAGSPHFVGTPTVTTS